MSIFTSTPATSMMYELCDEKVSENREGGMGGGRERLRERERERER